MENSQRLSSYLIGSNDAIGWWKWKPIPDRIECLLTRKWCCCIGKNVALSEAENWTDNCVLLFEPKNKWRPNYVNKLMVSENVGGHKMCMGAQVNQRTKISL